MRRVIINDRQDRQLFELAEADVFELTRHVVVNGEHSLTITTTQVLEVGWRVLHEDDRGRWHEHVVYGADSLHQSGDRPIGTYYCVWSLQHDLMGTRVSAMPGTQTPVTAAEALLAVLGGTSRWTRGTVTVTATGGASMYDMDGWTALGILTANWGGEVDATIEVGSSGVTARKVDLYAQQGEAEAKRRFDFGDDLRSVRRTVPDGPLYCRITPRGKGEETDGGGYGRKITIESVNDGKDYLEYAPMVELAKLPDGNGGWEYPTLEIENSSCETPAELKEWALSVIEDYLVPKVTYSVDVTQLAKEGVDMQGVSLGDAVHIVDRKFDLRIAARVMEIAADEIAGRTQKLTIGGFGESIADRLNTMSQGIAQANSKVDALGASLSTADYIDSLLERINAEINATGGYTYIVPGNGILTFDVAVADPLNPTEASRVVEIKGGTIRIANSKTAQGAWEWKTVFTSGHVTADIVTAANLVAGQIGSATSGTWWDLDNNLLHMAATTIVDNTTLGDALEDAGIANTMIRAYGAGVLICRKGNTVGALVNADGTFDVVAVTWSGDTPMASRTLATYGESFTMGTRASGTTAGTGSAAIGSAVTASGMYSFAQGFQTSATGSYSAAFGYQSTTSNGYSITTGRGCTASNQYGFAGGRDSISQGQGGFAYGDGAVANNSYETALGSYNVLSPYTGTNLLVVGNGSSNARKNAFTLSRAGQLTIAANLIQNSDRRLKTHVAYLGSDADTIIRRLKPAVFVKDGGRHYGFYAQDVQMADVWDTKTVEAHHTDESLGFDPLALDYTALIAPLTAYAQNLEKRVAELEKRIEKLEGGGE